MSEPVKNYPFPILGLLGVVFIDLKLCHVINWPWWWVTFPFWGGFAIILGLVVLAAVASAAMMFLAVVTELVISIGRGLSRKSKPRRPATYDRR